MPGTALRAEDTTVNKTDEYHALTNSQFCFRKADSKRGSTLIDNSRWR